VSPYKHAGPGGRGAPGWVHVVPVPDPFRGLHRGGGDDTGRLYARHVEEAFERIGAAGRRPAAFLHESIPSCAGQVVPPDGFLRRAYEHARRAGAVCIADEVQVGLGRVGSHFSAFEAQGVVPDVLTLGKPIGNGHPLAAAVTTPEVAAASEGGMEYFSTFGGNPVSCAAGLAVLDVLEEEGLQERAADLGKLLLAGLAHLAGRHELVGEVRGAGLFAGVQLVRDRETLGPAGREAARVVERLRDHGLLAGTDGPLRDVIKLKPPLVIGRDDVARFLEVLDAVLGETALRNDTLVADSDR